jgi:hypothetical protein
MRSHEPIRTGSPRLITRRLPPEDWPAALEKRPEDVKVVVDMTAAA